MSWPSYPSTRRSRSRSPRSSYLSRPQEGYAVDTSRDWEAYDRWQYERDRQPPPSDYSRRRSRSPATEDGSRKRRRSTSPYERDRYEPRPRYDDYGSHTRSYDHSPPRRPLPSHSSRRAPPDPHTFDYPASLKQYAEWFRHTFPQLAQEEDQADKTAEMEAADGSKPRNGIKSRWEKYKKDFAATQLQTMFEHHRKSPWFTEKYDPAEEYVNLRARVRKEGWRGYVQSFLQDLEAGKFDPDDPESDTVTKTFSKNGDVLNATNGASGIVPDERKGGQDDDMQFTIDGDDDAPEGDISRPDANGKLADRKGGKDFEEASVFPEGNQVMIRTIPPDIGRVKLEETCRQIPGFIYLALGDPLQKRNYYRAGWIRFKDGVDISSVLSDLGERKIEGFKLHLSHNTRPFTSRIRVTPEIASRPERIEKDLNSVKILAALLEDQAATYRQMKVTVGAAQDSAKDADQQDENSTVCEPDEEPAEKGSDAVERRIEKIMADWRDQNSEDAGDEKLLAAKRNVVALDLYIAYIRAAYHTCFYCCVTTDHLEELQRKCLKHVRKPLTKAILEDLKLEGENAPPERDLENIALGSPVLEKDTKKDVRDRWTDSRDARRNDDKWLDWFDSKLALLINRDGVDPREYGGKSYDDELKKVVEPHIKQEDEGKFRCRTCLKLFKASSFVEKHIVNKHPEHVKVLEEIPFFNNFALDPHRIQPFAHPPSNTGNGTQAPPQAFGIQASNDRYDSRRGDTYYNPSAGWNEHSSRRDDGTAARRLSDRLGGYSENPIHAGAGLPPKPTTAGLDSALPSGNGRKSRGMPMGLPPPPANAREDPRASAGKRVSYHDMDLVAEGDIELSY